VGQEICLVLWLEKSASPMHIQHLGFGVGAFIIPQIVKPFLGTTYPGHTSVDPTTSRIQIPYLLVSFYAAAVAVVFLFYHIRENGGRLMTSRPWWCRSLLCWNKRSTTTNTTMTTSTSAAVVDGEGMEIPVIAPLATTTAVATSETFDVVIVLREQSPPLRDDKSFRTKVMVVLVMGWYFQVR